MTARLCVPKFLPIANVVRDLICHVGRWAKSPSEEVHSERDDSPCAVDIRAAVFPIQSQALFRLETISASLFRSKDWPKCECLPICDGLFSVESRGRRWKRDQRARFYLQSWPCDAGVARHDLASRASLRGNTRSHQAGLSPAASADCDWLRRVDLCGCVRGPGCHSWRGSNCRCTSSCDEGCTTSKYRRRKPGARKQEVREQSMSEWSHARALAC